MAGNQKKIKQLGELTCPQKQIVTFTSTVMLCPFIKLGFAELAMVIENGFLIVNETGTRIKNSEYEKHGEEIYMCLKDYKSFFLKLSPRPYARRSSIEKVETDPKNILSFVCICLSLVCLLITLATYLVFKVLQTQPGINTIILCIWLLLAQGLFQFGAGQSSLQRWACSLIGAICHFLWLSVMFSMNVCSIQAYITFIKNRIISPTYSLKQTAIYITYIVLASLFFVVVNVVISLIRSGGHEVGYGGTICYLTSDLMQVVTFLIPTAVVLTLNIILFGIVVYKITKIGQITASLHQNKSYLLV
ncbi:MAG: 7 transmembrane receptor [Candidatus Thiodiazotropha sp.]